MSPRAVRRERRMIKSKPVGWVLFVGFLVLLCSGSLVLADESPQRRGKPPEGKLKMKGDIGDFVPGVIDDPVHDPTLVKDPKVGGTYYVFSTGILNPDDPGGIFARRSTETLAGPWESLGEIPLPEWTLDYNVNHLWAPDVVKQHDTYFLYYSASSFGVNTSAIGAARTKTPGDLDSWEDLGPILTSDPSVDYNAIDPSVFEDHGKWWIAFGSFWDGIKLQELENMTKPTGPIYSLARRPDVEFNPIENAAMFKRGKYYYLLTSWDFCCRGTNSTYKVAVGRSESITGPYVDKDGVPLEEGGGTVILSSHANQIGPGGQDVYKEFGKVYMIHHYYDGDANGVIRMQIRSMDWQDGWPYFAEW
jgi:arabinan endo-1,5-alpha-L-arabinosidase